MHRLEPKKDSQTAATEVLSKASCTGSDGCSHGAGVRTTARA